MTFLVSVVMEKILSSCNKGFKNVQKGYDIIKAYKKKYAEQEGNLEWLI
jgi:hypothetical protein